MNRPSPESSRMPRGMGDSGLVSGEKKMVKTGCLTLLSVAILAQDPGHVTQDMRPRTGEPRQVMQEQVIQDR